MTDGPGATPRILVHRPGDAWEAESDLVIGELLDVELHPAGGYGWSPVISSDDSVAEVSGTVDEGGVARFTVEGKAPGVAHLSATTEHRGDRFGPPARRWILRLRVVGAAT